MVKKNKLLIGCLASILVLSIGYALFSEIITINGTATAKGSFDITTTCAPGYSDEFIEAAVNMGVTNINKDTGQTGFSNDICTVDDNVITMTTDLLYPTAVRRFTIKMTNTGSIPSIIWGATDGGRIESLGASFGASYSLKNKETDEVIKSGQGYSIRLGIGTYIFFESLTYPKIDANNNILLDVVYDKNKQYAGIKLEPGESIFTITKFIYPKDSDLIMSDNGNSEYFEFKVNHEFKWEQYADSPNYEEANFNDFCFAGC